MAAKDAAARAVVILRRSYCVLSFLSWIFFLLLNLIMIYYSIVVGNSKESTDKIMIAFQIVAMLKK